MCSDLYVFCVINEILLYTIPKSTVEREKKDGNARATTDALYVFANVNLSVNVCVGVDLFIFAIAICFYANKLYIRNNEVRE